MTHVEPGLITVMYYSDTYGDVGLRIIRPTYNYILVCLNTDDCVLKKLNRNHTQIWSRIIDISTCSKLSKAREAFNIGKSWDDRVVRFHNPQGPQPQTMTT